MTIHEAIKTINKAEIMSLNTPIQELQSAVQTVMRAAMRAATYDKHIMDVNSKDIVSVPYCEKCAYNEGIAYWHQCEHCIGNATNNFVAITEVNREKAEP